MHKTESRFRLSGTICLGLTLLAFVTLCPQAEAAREGNYLIITPPFFDNSTPLNHFIDDRTAKGFNVMKYVVPTGTTKETIKTYIVNLWETADAPDFVLIIGDTPGSSSASTSTTIPNWVGSASRHGDTDMYYITMPGGVEWYPDIPIGRFSVTTIESLENVVNKTLFVEAGVFPDPGYPKRGAFLANPDTAGLAEPTHDYVIENYFEPLGYEGIRIYSSDGGTTSMVTNAVNNGVMFCLYMGHSDSSGWWDPSFRQSNINNLNNTGLYPLVFGWSCNTAHYTYAECAGETWLRAVNKGAVAYISASNYIFWGGYNEWLPSAHHEKAFFHSFFEDDIWEVGPAWREGCFTFLKTYGNWDGDMNHQPTSNLDYCRNFVEEFVLLGDPALLLPRLPLRINLRDTLPEYIAAGTSLRIKVDIQEGGEAYLPDSGRMYYRFDNGEFLSMPLITSDGLTFEATLPAVACNDFPQFYFYAEGDGGSVVTLPNTAPVDYFSTIVGTPEIAFHDNFETDTGWTTEILGATDGFWERADPVNDPTYQYDPPSDSDGSGMCYVTDNASGNSDVDGGAVRLISPVLDLSEPGVSISYDYYLYLTSSGAEDHLLVEINSDGGAGTWTTIADHNIHNALAWTHHEISATEIANLGVPLTSTMQVRFTANDDTPSSIVEAGVDAFEVVAFTCDTDCYGDLNGDNAITIADLATLLANYGAPSPTPEDGDLNGDGSVDLSDLAGLLSVYGTTCP